MLISPTEPKYLCSLGTTSSIPERYGTDYLFDGLIGVQRKEIGDLVNSVQDGRLGKELAQMKQLNQGILMIEGTWQWTDEGQWMGRSRWTWKQQQSLVYSVQSQGCLTVGVSNLGESKRWLLWLEKKLAGKTYKQQAKELGIPAPHITLYLQGKKHVSMERQFRIAEYFGVSVVELFAPPQLSNEIVQL